MAVVAAWIMFYLPLNMQRCLATGVLLLCSQWLLAAQEDERFDALLIYGSGGMTTWSQNFNDSFRSYLGSDLEQFFIPEFVALVNADESEYELIARSLALKYSNTDIDLLVPVLPEANSFVHRWQYLLAPDAAVIHVLPGNDILGDGETPGPNEAIVRSAVTEAVAQTVTLMPSLLPDLERVYVVGGVGDGDLSYRQRYQATIDELATDLQFEYLSGLPPEELVNTLQQAPADSAILMTTYDRDNKGRSYRSRLVTQQLSEQLSIPIFANTNTLVRFGAMGGSITSAEAYARMAHEMVMGIMGGDAPADSSISSNSFMFNGGQLDRFNINRGLLPSDSQIILEQPSLWRDYGQWIIVATLIIAAQLALIGLLLESRRRQRLAEAELSKTQKMEALGSLAGGIAHDFNNILMAISANTELANLQIENKSQVRDRLARIHSASERAEHLVSQILMFSRQAQQQELKTIQLCALLDDSVEHIRSLMPAECKVEFHCKAPKAFVEADANQLHQVFMNLCINSQHAMEGKGLITITANEYEIDSHRNFLGQEIPAAKYVELTFNDTGSGIDPANLRHVFEPFFTTKPMGKGTGLGLALVYQTVKAHSGFIDIQSIRGEGTTVSVFLPSGAGKQTSEISKPGAIIKGDNELVLLVDDDEMVLDANRENLLSLGYKVTSFSKPVAALQYFREHSQNVNLLLTDLSMPEMDGVRLISNIHQIRPELPVILCTGYLDALQSPDLGELQILKKPFSIPEISEALHEALHASSET